MNKKLILYSVAFLAFIFTINFISASLCLGYDNYYHDCDDSRYFHTHDTYYYHGKYYPSRYYDHYRYSRDDGLTYKDTEEYKRTIEYSYKDRGISESIRYTINEKTETNLHYDAPYVFIYNYDTNEKEDRKWHDFLYDAEPVPYTSYWRGN